jgi:thiol-disulfide isomerase/thioredoxin
MIAVTVVTVLAFAVLAILVYRFWKPKPKREVPVGEARLYFFYTEWCGWSQKAIPEWEKLEQELKQVSRFGKTHITPVRVNAEEDRETAMLYEIEAFPTILLETSDGLYPYDKVPKAEGLLAFLEQTLGKKA